MYFIGFNYIYQQIELTKIGYSWIQKMKNVFETENIVFYFEVDKKVLTWDLWKVSTTFHEHEIYDHFTPKVISKQITQPVSELQEDFGISISN